MKTFALLLHWPSPPETRCTVVTPDSGGPDSLRQCLFALLILQSLFLASIRAQSVEVCNGVVADPAAEMVYIMNAEGVIEALRSDSGTPVWTSTIAARPLALQGNLLICMSKRSVSGQLKLVSLDAANTGALVSGDSLVLPEGVQAMVDQGMGATFTAQVRTSGQEIYLYWEFQSQPVSGIDRRANPRSGVKNPETRDYRSNNGVIAYSAQTRALRNVDISQVPQAARMRSSVLSPEESVLDLQDNQYLSIDEKHILTVQRIADNRQWNKYQWTIYEQASGEKLGSFRLFQGRSDFVVVSGLVLLETTSYGKREEEGFVTSPRLLRAMDPVTSREIWQAELRETRYIGSFPP